MTTILFPFQLEGQNKDYFLKSMALAEDKKANLLCITNIGMISKTDLAYLHLLELYENYQTNKNNWQPQVIKTERMIEVNSFETIITTVLRDKKRNIIGITCPANNSSLRKKLETIIASKGILKEQLIYIY